MDGCSAVRCEAQAGRAADKALSAPCAGQEPSKLSRTFGGATTMLKLQSPGGVASVDITCSMILVQYQCMISDLDNSLCLMCMKPKCTRASHFRKL